MSRTLTSIAALAALLLVQISCGGGAQVDNVILISVDTLRADRLGCYGYPEGTSPALDRLAADGVRFAQAISHSPWTTPSHMSLMTSLHPTTHTVTQGWKEFRRFSKGKGGYRVLPERVTTLAQVLHGHGFRTLAITGGGTVGAALGFDRGFDDYRSGARKLSPEVWSRLQSLLDDDDQRSFFLFFHTFEVHAPYLHVDDAAPLLTAAEEAELRHFIATHPEMTEGQLKRYLSDRGLLRVDITSRLYDGGIRYTDWFLGRFFDALEERGLWERTLIVVTSDHGEEFADHRADKFYNVHCHTLYDELLHVPLILRAPGRFSDGRVVRQQVRLIDVAPTILDLLKIPVPDQMQGISLVPVMEGRADTGPLPAYSEALCIGPEWKSLRTEHYKYMVGFGKVTERMGIPGVPQGERLFDLGRDPGEHENLASSDAGRATQLRRQLFKHLRREARRNLGERRTLQLDPELESELRALGYVD